MAKKVAYVVFVGRKTGIFTSWDEVKAQVKQAAEKTAGDMDAYLMLSFDNIENKNRFLQRFGYDADMKFVKGEDFDMRCEVIDEGEE